MRYRLAEVPYNRKAAVAYADYWAYRRNPKYYAFDEIGGDCTNFVSQCVFAGCGVMNDTPDYGWYYYNVNDRAPAWTGVGYFYRFLTENRGAGPFGREAPGGNAAARGCDPAGIRREGGLQPYGAGDGKRGHAGDNPHCLPRQQCKLPPPRHLCVQPGAGDRIEGARHLLAEEKR